MAFTMRVTLRQHGKLTLHGAAPVELCRDGELSSAARSIAFYLWSHKDGYQRDSKALAEALKLDRGTVRKGLANLEERGWLVRQEFARPGRRSSREVWHLQRADQPFTPEEIQTLKTSVEIPERVDGGQSEAIEADDSCGKIHHETTPEPADSVVDFSPPIEEPCGKIHHQSEIGGEKSTNISSTSLLSSAEEMSSAHTARERDSIEADIENLCALLLAGMTRNWESSARLQRLHPQPTITRAWPETMRWLIVDRGESVADIRAVIEHSQGEWWSTRVPGIAKFREHYDSVAAQVDGNQRAATPASDGKSKRVRDLEAIDTAFFGPQPAALLSRQDELPPGLVIDDPLAHLMNTVNHELRNEAA